MSYNITPTSGINLDDVVQTNPNSAGTGINFGLDIFQFQLHF